jgi:hypothetical protein
MMKNLWLTLALLGAVVPMSAFMPWVQEHGFSLSGLIREMFATDISRFLSLDLVVSAVSVFVLVARGTRRGVPHAWLAAVATVGVGVSMGLPLYLYLEACHDEASAKARSGLERG